MFVKRDLCKLWGTENAFIYASAAVMIAME